MKKLTQFLGAKAFFAVVFLNAFVDLGHKILIQNTLFKLYDGPEQVVLTAILNALILLPFILLLTPAGYISDHCKKVSVMRRSAWFAVACCAVICVSYFLGLFQLAFAMTFLLAAQSAIYSPAKSGFIKELFGKSRLGEANGIASALSIIAILSGIFCFSIAFEAWFDVNAKNESDVLRSIAPAGFILLATAIAELVLCYRLPLSNDAVDVKPVPFTLKGMYRGNFITGSLSPLIHSRQIRLAVIGLSTFWAVGQVMLAAFPAFIKTQTGMDNTVAIQGVLACSGIGIALGSFVAGRMSKDHIEVGILPFGALGLAVGLFFLPSVTTLSAAACLFFIIGFSGGLFIVPLNALIQFQTADDKLGQALAANNWLQNVTMLSFLVLTAGFAYWGLSAKILLHIIAAVALVGSLYTLVQLPRSFLRVAVSIILRRHYRLTVQDVRNIPSEGGALLLGNHISWIDWAILQIAVPRPVRFVMINSIYERWYLKWLLQLFRCIPISQGAASRSALDTVAECLNRGDVVCLFPEGAISRTGHLVDFRKGFERCCEKVDTAVPIIPFYLHGLWGSQFSRSSPGASRIEKNGSKRDIVVSFGDALPNTTTAPELKQKVHALSITAWQATMDNHPGLGEEWVRAAKSAPKRMYIADSQGAKVSALQALSGTLLMARYLKPKLSGQNVGVLLPSSSAGALGNLALLMLGKTIVNVNYSASLDNLHSAFEQASIKSIVSSRKFVQKLKMKGIDLENILGDKCVIYLEDFRDHITPVHKLTAFLLCRLLPTRVLVALFCQKQDPKNTAAILFSSGSEGKPKGVCLSHQNIAANVKQTAVVLNPELDEVVMANLPLFHAFGLTATLFLPLLQGIPVVFHPDPTDALGSAKAMARHRVSLLFGTSTFLRLFTKNRKVHPLMLESLRLVVAGAEKLRPEVRQEFSDKFRKPIYEGYGATEASPVVSVNMPDRIGLQDLTVQLGQKLGSVGLPLPGTSIRVVDPVTFELLPAGEAGLILIAGVQIMKGYLNNVEKTAEVLKELNGCRWYCTGDKGYLDEDGFVFIIDRYSRFAKIGGEMVSLLQVEEAIKSILFNAYEDKDAIPEILSVNLPHSTKGEQIVLLSTKDINEHVTPATLSEAGLSKLAIPAKIHAVENIPTLPSGKVDMQEAKRMASTLAQ